MDSDGDLAHNPAMLDVRINAAARFICEPDWSWDTAGAEWSDTDLRLALSGRGRLRTPERAYPVGRGDCFLLRGRRRYRGTHDPTAPLTVMAVHFDVIRDNRVVTLPDQLRQEHRHLDDPEFVSQCLERLLQSRNGTESMGDPFGSRQHAAAFWLKAALREIIRVDSGESNGDADPVARIRRLCDYLRTHPTERHELSDLAGSCNLSQTHFSRLFRRETGVSPGRFLIQNRIEAAKSLLRDSDHPMKRVAQILGYQDQYFFSRQFRRETGMSPHEYRHQRTLTASE